MKILHVVCEYPSSERPFANTFIKSQIESLKEFGGEHYIFDIEGYKSDLNYLKSIPKIKNIVKRQKINLIHAHYSYAGISSYLSFPKIPIVLSLMGSDLLGVPNKNGEIKIRGKIDNKISNFIANRVNHIIVKSSDMKNHLETSIPLSVIPNGVNFNVFKSCEIKNARKELQLNEKDFIILFLGNPKNVRKNFHLAKIATDKFSLKNKNVSLLNPYGINSEEVVKYMNSANVLLLTSFWEGSPNVIKEAMACNLPIISTDVGDVNEIISNTEGCYIVDFSVEEIIEKLEIIYKNRIRTNGFSKIQHLKNEIIAEKIVKTYTKTLNKY